MASDNKVSSFFLLILFGLAIYYLLNYEEFTLLNKLTDNLQETFVNNSADEEDFFDEEEVFNEETHSSMLPQVVKEEPSTSEFQYDVRSEPYVPQSVINDIAINQQNNVTQQSDNVTQQSDNVTQQQSDNVTQQQMGIGVYNFQPNDESELGVNGSSLNDAFALPVPHGAQTDAIDFKKQNVDNYNAKDFLPREINDEWFETDFSLAKYQLNDDKLINTEKYIIGINTVGQSLKNASWDIRGTIPNPKVVVSPWNNSTYEPDFNLKPLC